MPPNADGVTDFLQLPPPISVAASWLTTIFNYTAMVTNNYVMCVSEVWWESLFTHMSDGG